MQGFARHGRPTCFATAENAKTLNGNVSSGTIISTPIARAGTDAGGKETATVTDSHSNCILKLITLREW
jgi:hypothetical protein